MATFKVQFNCDNASFVGDPEDDMAERDEAMRDGIKAALFDVVKRIDAADSDLELGGTIFDANGNTIGHFTFTP